MGRLICCVVFMVLILQLFITTVSAKRARLQSAGASTVCPMDFGELRRLAQADKMPSVDPLSECQYIRQGLRLVQSEYLRRSNSFLPPLDSSESCWDSYDSLVNDYIPNFNIRRRCGFQTTWIARGCMNITSRVAFESVVPQAALKDVVTACNQSLLNNSPCATCTTALSSLQASYLSGPTDGNVSDCTAYPFIYAAAFANQFGPTDKGTAKCLFNLDFTSSTSSGRTRVILISVVAAVCGLVLILGFSGFLFLRGKRQEVQGKSGRT